MARDARVTAAGPGFDRLFDDPVLRRLSIVVVIGSVMSLLDTTIVNVAIETLGRDFHTTVTTVQWVTTGYLLALAIVIPASGWAVERFGAKRMWMLSLVVFTAGSAACALAWSPESLIAFRVLQGMGGGMIMPIGQMVIARAAGPARMGRMMSVLGVPTLLAPVLGPVIGGLIVSHITWRWIFLVNLPIGVLAVALSATWLADDERHHPGRFDFVGLALLSPGLALLIYGLSQAGAGSGLASPEVMIGAGVGLALLVAFVAWSRHASEPLVDVGLFKDKTFAVANLVSFIFGAGLYAAMILLPLYYQTVRGESALVAGLLMAPQGLGAMATMPIGGKVTDRVGARRVVPIGMVVFTLGTLAYTQVGPSTGYAGLALSLFVRGMGMGWIMMPITAAAYAALPRIAVARATTALSIVMRVGGAFGTALAAVVLQRSIDARLPALSGVLSQGAVRTSSGSVPLAISRPLASAFGVTFWVVVGIGVAGLVSSVLLPRGAAAHRPLVEVPDPDAASADAAAGLLAPGE